MLNLYHQKIKNKKAVGILTVAVILALFLLRGVLLQNGTIDRMYTLEPDQLHEAMAKYEVRISGEAGGAGTILDGRKQSSRETEYTLTIATAAHVVGNDDKVSVSFSDGTTAEGSVLYMDEEQDLALIQCLCSEEKEVYYSRDLLERLAPEDAAYAIKGDEKESMVSGTITDPSAQVDGIGSDLILADIGGENGMSGGGLYGKAGNYLGMIVQGTQEGSVVCIPASTVMDEMKQHI